MSENSPLDLPFPMPPYCLFHKMEVLECGGGTSWLSMPFTEQMKQPFGIMHGGALFALADAAVAYAIGAVEGKEKQFVTIEMKINYLAPVSSGTVEARAKLLRRGRIVPGEVDLYNENKLVAKAIATYIILDQDKRL